MVPSSCCSRKVSAATSPIPGTEFRSASASCQTRDVLIAGLMSRSTGFPARARCGCTVSTGFTEFTLLQSHRGSSDEAVQVPMLWATALLREHGLRALLAQARLPPGAERALGARAGGRRLARARRAEPALPLLRQRRLRRVQLARAGRRLR